MSEYSESFELWAQKNGYAMQRAGAISSYVAPLTQCAWLAWKAGSAAAQARISELEATMDAILKLIDDAPHDGGCDVYVNGLAQMCTCWKSKIGSK